MAEQFDRHRFDSSSVNVTKQQSAALVERMMEICSLYVLSKSLSLCLDADEVFEGAESLIKESLNIDSFSIMLMDDEGKRLSLWRSSDPDIKNASVSFELGEGVSGTVAATGKAKMVADVANEPLFAKRKSVGEISGALYSTPLMDGNSVFGVFNVHKSVPGSIKPSETSMYDAAAWHIAEALTHSKSFQETKRLSITDELTGLYSRRYFFDVLEKEFSKTKRTGAALAVAMFDLDYFKRINDTYGHQTGDEALRMFGDILERNIRQGDVAARYGGEEFVVLLPGAGVVEARMVAEKLRVAVAEELRFQVEDGSELTVTVSGGVAAYPEDGSSPDELVLNADKELLNAKRSGRNSVCATSGQETSSVTERRSKPRQTIRIYVEGDEPGVRSIDIMIDDEWKCCAVEDVSGGGFKAVVGFEPEVGKDYPARVSFNVTSESEAPFSINCVRAETLPERGYVIGAMVVGDSPRWREAYRMISC